MQKIKDQLGRVCILLMDSLGIGASFDASNYQDQDADTFGHIHSAALAGRANQINLRTGPMHIPNLTKLGLYHAAIASTGKRLLDLSQISRPRGYYGYAVEQCAGKDTISGHWELAGVNFDFTWGYFPHTIPCFPKLLIDEFIQKAQLIGVLAEKHASGTEVIEEFGAEHIITGKPIIYTSADSVLQIAAHEDYFGLQRLYQICEIARELVDEYRIGRVIARPFIGEPGDFIRTSNRRDYSTVPPTPTLLDKLQAAQREVIGIGKIADIFSYQGITQAIKADNNMSLFDATLDAMQQASPGSLIFTNFVDFDSLFGHRRNLIGYAHALEEFDVRLAELEAVLQAQDLVVITADHGCDPSMPGSDHTREHIPVLAYGPEILSKFIGRRESFADIGQAIAEYLQIDALPYGVSFL